MKQHSSMGDAVTAHLQRRAGEKAASRARRQAREIARGELSRAEAIGRHPSGRFQSDRKRSGRSR